MREMLEPFFGEIGAILTQFVIALIGVLILVGAVYWLYKWIVGDSVGAKVHRRNPRLAIIDALPIDNRRKIILFRRDNVEHLVLVGGSADLVIETQIIRSAQAGGRPRQAQMQRSQPQHDTETPVQQDSTGAQPLQPIEPPVMASGPRPAVAGFSEPAPFVQDAQPRQIAEIDQTIAETADQAEADVTEAAPQPVAEGDTASRQALGAPEPVPFTPNPRQPQIADFGETETEPASLDHDETILAEAARQSAPSGSAAPAAARPAMADAGNAVSAPGSAHFEEPTKPTEVRTMFSQLDTASEHADEPNSVAKSEEQAAPQPESAFPIDEVQATAASDIDDEGTEAVEIAARLQPTLAVDEPATSSESSEAIDTENAAKVRNLEQEMALLLNKITPKREI